MADERVRDFGTTLTPTQKSDLQNVFLWVDKTGWTEAQKLEAISLLIDTIIADNTNDYQAMTPKSFYDSIMQEARFGIGRFATSDEIAEKTTDGLLRASLQDTMQTQWDKDWNSGNATVNVFTYSGDIALGIPDSKAISYKGVYHGDLTAGQYKNIQPNKLPAVKWRAAYVNVMLKVGANVYTGTYLIQRPGVGQYSYINISTSGISLFMYNDGADFGIYSTGASTDVAVSMDVNMVIQ